MSSLVFYDILGQLERIDVVKKFMEYDKVIQVKF